LTIASSGSGSGSVTSVSVVSANGLAGTVANPTTTPSLTLSTTITGVLKGNGTAISAAVAGTDYVIPSGSITGTASNITATSNSTLTTLSALSLPGSQVTGNISGNASNITATSNNTLTTLSALSLPYSQLTGVPPISGFTQGSVLFANSGGQIAQDNSNFYWNDSTLNLGLGIIPATTVTLDTVNTTGASKAIQNTSYGVGSTIPFRGRFARGTSGSPAAAQSGDVLSVLSGRGYGASQFAANSTGAINIVAGETFTNASNLTYLQFQATPTGSITAAEHMRVAATGVTLGPQSSSTDIHSLNGGIVRTINTITSTYTIDSVTTDYTVLCNASSAINVTLPNPAVTGRTLVIKDISGAASTNNITILQHASETIEGLNSSYLIQGNFQSVNLQSDGTNWWLIK
jgi:hypothetical protein